MRFRSVSHQEIDLCRTVDSWVHPYVPAIIKSYVLECQFAEFTYTVGVPRSNYIVVGFGLLQHQMHSFDVIAGMAPITSRIQIPQCQLRCKPELDFRDSV